LAGLINTLFFGHLQMTYTNKNKNKGESRKKKDCAQPYKKQNGKPLSEFPVFTLILFDDL